MPIGIALIGWTNKTGFYTIYQYPQILITEEEVMRIGSIHRMRYLEPSFITLNLKNYKVASFYSGMKTSRWVVEPNYVISLILDPSENAEAYSEILPVASLRILESVKGEHYQNMVAAVFEDIKLGRIIVKKEIIQKIFPPKTEEKVDLRELQELKQKVKEQEGIIKMLQGMLEEKNIGSTPNIQNLAELDMLKTRLRMKDEKIEELKKKVSEAEIKASRVTLLETRIRTITADLNEKNEYIKELKQKLADATAHGGVSISSSESDEIRRLKQIIIEKDNIIKQLQAQVDSSGFEKIAVSKISSELDDKEGYSKYISL
ncbi:MAG: hypothetical protein ACTSPQ_13845 [Candidatus Helarchaeota archaeon]